MAARQALMAQQYGGMQMGAPNGTNQISPAQYAAMRAGGPMARSVNLPQHLQQAQQQAQQSLEHQQAQQHQVSEHYSVARENTLNRYNLIALDANH